jgi:CubicO group peptidase (beta-lactamase class C family)
MRFPIRLAALWALIASLAVALPASAAPPSTPAATAPAAHALTAEDVSAWFDGLIPDAIGRADIAGAVVVVVKDGQPLFERGYGVADVRTRRPADAQTTLFRPGSVSKLFTWTAVMQQVEAGRIDLDADVNRYLDFKIPPYHGAPITMRQLMTHSSGLSDPSKDLIVKDPARFKPLETLLKTEIPERIYPPGTTVAYSNYGAALAGYIVQRVSGERFEDYIARHILAPLGMSRSTFEQPLPKLLAADMSQGYRTASSPPGRYELLGLAPAGALAATGSDMGRFMIAHLQHGEFQGQRILRPETADMMHNWQFRPVPSIPSMALGFYQEPANGHRVVAHAGNTGQFHSDLHLFLDDNVGLFVSFNSDGPAAASARIRTALFRGFTNRYFPAPASAEPPTWPSAKADGKVLAGYYLESRRSDSGWLRMPAYLFGQTKVVSDPDGVVTVPGYLGVNGRPQRWREVGPFQYREIGGPSHMAAVVRGGRVVDIMTDGDHPVQSLKPVPAAMSAAWNRPLFFAAFWTLVVAAASWPATAFLRWRYSQPFPLADRAARLYRLTRVVCLVDLAFAGLWFWFMSHHGDDWLSSGNDWIIRLIQLVGLLGVVGVVAPLANAGLVLRDGSRGWFAKASAVAIAAACVAAIWFAFSLGLITPTVAY